MILTTTPSFLRGGRMFKRLISLFLFPLLVFAQAPQVSVTTRQSTGAPLTFTQADKNFTDLRDAVNNINAKIISAKDFGAKGDGSTDDATAINAGLTAINAAGGGRLFLSPGTYIIGSAINYPGNNISLEGAGQGHTIIKAKNGAAFEYMITAASRTSIGLSNLTVDVNQANRFTALQAAGGGPLRGVGVNWTSPIDGRIHNVLVKNAVGNGTIPGVGIAIGGVSGLRNIISNCTALDCGTSGYASDGFYASGTQTLITNCVAKNCLDTGFVLEMSNYSGIVGCTAIDCGAGGGITAVSTGDCYGNYINGLTVENPVSTVTGCVVVSALGTSDLYDTSVTGLVIHNATGPAFNMRKASTGRIKNTTLAGCVIKGSTAQGIVVDGADGVVISGCIVNGTVNACIQVQTGCTSVLVTGCYLSPAGPNTFGFVSTDGTDICVKNNLIFATAGQMTYGVYFFGTGTRCSSLLNNVQGSSNAMTGADGTTTPIVLAPMNTASGFYFGKAATTNLYDLSGVLKTDQAFISALTIKALGNVIEVGPTGASSGNGGSFRTRNDAGTASWLMGHLGSGGATAWVLYDQAAALAPISIAQGSAGTMTFGDTSKRIAAFTGNVNLTTVGKTVGIKEGTNAKMGTATLAAGSVVVSTTAVAANSRIQVTGNADGGTPGWLRVSARTAGTSFTITSSSGTDTSTVAWVILDPL